MIVYITTNIVNGRKYIGKDVANRKYYLGSGKALRLAIAKYGKESFIKEVLATVSTQEELIEMEKYYIEYYRACESNLFYNIASGGLGGGAQGRILSEATKLKMSQSAKRNMTDERRKELALQINKNHSCKGKFGKDHFSSKEVFQYDFNGNFIAYHESLTLAAQRTDSHISKISLCLRGKRKTTNGYIWKKE